MKRFLLIALIVAFVWVVQAEEKILHLGDHPFYKSNNLKAGDLKKIATDRVGDVKIAFEEAGYGELVYAFLEQIQKADIQTTEVQPGQKLNWMSFKEGKKVKIVKDAVWAGKKSFKAYQFIIFRNGNLYTFIVPLMCGNISMLGSEAVPAPVCSLNVTPTEVEKGKSFKVDVCDTKNGLKNVVTISDSAGTVVKTLELTPENCTAEVLLENPGSYTVDNVAEGKYGMKSTNPCKVEVKVVLPPPPIVAPVVGEKGGKGAAAHKLNFIADIGLARMKDPTTFLFIRAGIQYPFSEVVRLNLLVGPWLNLYSSSYGSAFAIDATLSFYFSRFWLGGGVGYWLKKDDNKVDLIGNIGVEIFKTDTINGSIFLEGRWGLTDFDVMADFWRYALGFRLGITPKK